MPNWVKVRYLKDYHDYGAGWVWKGQVERITDWLAEEFVKQGICTLHEQKLGDVIYLVQIEKQVKESDARSLAEQLGATLETDAKKWSAAAIASLDELNSDRVCTGTVYEQTEDGKGWIAVATFNLDYGNSDEPKISLSVCCPQCRSGRIIKSALERAIACYSCGWNLEFVGSSVVPGVV